MARIYTPTLFTEDMIVSPDHLNLETKGLMDQWNRSLDCNNIPVESITAPFFVDRLRQTDGTFKISRGQFSDYYEGWNNTSVTTPQWSVNLRTSTAVNHGQWNEIPLAEADIIFTNLKEGLLYGDVVIDWERRRGHEASGGGAGARTDDLHWHQEFAVFFDGRPISESGPLRCRRDTLVLDFCWPVNSGRHTLDVRFRVKSGELPSVATTYNQPFSVYGLGWHVRNVFR